MSKKPRLYNCIAMTQERLRTLQEMARLPNGAAHVRGVLEGAHMATLVSMGLAERLPGDAHLGGCRYRLNAAGLELAGVADASAARTGGAA